MKPRPRRGEFAFDQPSTRRFLPWLIAAMVMLGALALAGALALGSMTASWDNALRGRVTVQVPRTSGDGAASLEKILLLVEATPGVVSVRSLADDQITSLLAPWLGGDFGMTDLPIP